MKKSEWWESNGGFFGEKYIEGDDSIEGFIPNQKESLFKRTKREVEGIINLTKIKKEDNILDIPCGYGRYAIALAKKGFQVTGIDINEAHLKKAKEDSQKQKINFLKEDMINIGNENYNKFDFGINMFYSFGFFKKEEDNQKSMQEFYNALKNGGKLLLHTDVSPEMFEGGNYRFKEERTLTNGKRLIIDEKYNSKNRRMAGSWTIVSKSGKESLPPYSVRIYTKEEFEIMARKGGFKKGKFYGSFEGDNFDKNSSELIMVAEK